MTAHELAKILLNGPDLMVTVRGYEGGVDEISLVDKPAELYLNVNSEWYYGKHEFAYDYEDKDNYKTTQAIYIGT